MNNLSGRIQLSDVTREFKLPDGTGLKVLDAVNLLVTGGETVAIVGPSGAGKSTLLNLIGALDKPTSGTILLDEINVTSLNGAALAQYRAKQVGFIFQEHHLLPQLSALENVLLPTLALTTEAGEQKRAGMLLKQVGLETRLHAKPATLSGGERQRVAVARALMMQPKVLLCDEPTGNLDQETAHGVMQLLLELAQSEGVTVVMVTHNQEHAAMMQRIIRLHGGHLQELEQEARA